MNDLKIDKLNGVIAFNEEYHKYFNIKNPEYVYTSVTTIIGQYHEKFNSEFFSIYKAIEALGNPEYFADIKPYMLSNQKSFTPAKYDYCLEAMELTKDAVEAEREVILARWAATNKEACDIGTEFHLERENEWYDKYDSLVKKRLPVTGDFICKKNDFSLDREKAVIPEFLVYYSCPDKILHLAGQVDLLIKDGNDIYILDYKTNAKGIETKAFFDRSKKRNKSMFYPISNLDDTTMNHYNLQLSIYAFMLQKLRPEFNIKMLKLIHIDRDGNETEFEVPYLKTEVMRLLAYHKKQIFIDQKRNQDEIGA